MGALLSAGCSARWRDLATPMEKRMLPLAALAWVGLHLGVAGSPLRLSLVRLAGERAFRGVFSLASVALLAAMILAFRATPTQMLWTTPFWLRVLLAALMLPALILFVGSVSQPNPTSVGGGSAGGGPARGPVRVTRHPMLWAFAIWAAVHVVGNGDTAALVFFGAFLVTALAGMPSIDQKLARRDPTAWRALAASTSIIPFAAIAQGRNRLVPGEYGWLRLAIAVIAWAVLLYLHPVIFGVGAIA